MQHTTNGYVARTDAELQPEKPEHVVVAIEKEELVRASTGVLAPAAPIRLTKDS